MSEVIPASEGVQTPPSPAAQPIPAPVSPQTTPEADSLRKENENLRQQVKSAEEASRSANAEEVARLNVELKRNEILLENPEIAGRLKPILDTNKYAVWGTEEQMRAQIEALNGVVTPKSGGNDESTPSGGSSGTNPPAVPGTSDPARVQDMNEDQAWAAPFDQLEESLSNLPGMKYTHKSRKGI
jgi:hypothetical protein